MGITDTALTQTVVTGVLTMKRLMAKNRDPVRKATPFGKAQLKILIDYVIYDPISKGLSISTNDFRSVIRAVVIFWSWCRFSDFETITDKITFDHGNFIKIMFPKSKQDQLYNGTISYLPEQGGKYCPCTLLRMYFTLYNLEFGYTGPVNRYINFSVYKTSQGHSPKLYQSISYTTAVEHMRQLFKRVNLDGHLYTETSFKAGGVTEFLNSGNSLHQCMVHGRWASLMTPEFYRRDSDDYRLFLASRIAPIM